MKRMPYELWSNNLYNSKFYNIISIIKYYEYIRKIKLKILMFLNFIFLICLNSWTNTIIIRIFISYVAYGYTWLGFEFNTSMNNYSLINRYKSSYNGIIKKKVKFKATMLSKKSRLFFTFTKNCFRFFFTWKV